MSDSEEHPVVTTVSGKVRGTVQYTNDLPDRPVYTFKGIPYAAPPVGDLRFRAPKPAVQGRGRESGMPLSQAASVNRTVLLWIHGGGLMAGGGDTTPFTSLAAHQDVVVVTINYRLGPFGFLSTGDENAPGNSGFLDQIQAMVWVQENIRVFGGDAKRVTIFGESAGGTSACYQVVSPLSKGLFQRAISQSGVCDTIDVNPMIRDVSRGTQLRH
ncbi:putative inactive carboxylesterase 4 [Branchiostoma lanceolatum]|uniref:putative inactive carboxylesterase 4 n=1 Tax=Branchiostoma lanceolatum TaxID=7740 RepID=UPI0034534CEC